MENIIILICLIMAILWLMILIIKTIVTDNHYLKIGGAIHKYKIDCIRNHKWDDLHSIEYEDMEPYEKTFHEREVICQKE